MIEYEVGAIPSRSATLLVRDELDNPVNIVGYDIELEMLDSDNEPVDLSGIQIFQIPQAIGMIAVTWPTNRSLFNKRGKYLLRLVMRTDSGAVDITRTAEIRVRDFGRIK